MSRIIGTIAQLQGELTAIAIELVAASVYEKIDFTPPEGAKKAAERGMELRSKFGRGGMSESEAGDQGIWSGVKTARALRSGKAISPELVRRMNRYFTRHQKDKDAKGSDSAGYWGNPSNPSAGYIAWLLWGGDAANSWSGKVIRQMESAEEKAG
jgi:hypothetical protein